MVTGIGVSSTAEGWRQPARPRGALDLELQSRFYEALHRALRVSRRLEYEPAGTFIWCWWTDPDAGGALERGFTPQNKPAQAWLGRMLRAR